MNAVSPMGGVIFSGRQAEKTNRGAWEKWVVAEVLAARRAGIRPRAIGKALGMTTKQVSSLVHSSGATVPPLRTEKRTPPPLPWEVVPLEEEAPRCLTVWQEVLLMALDDAAGKLVAVGDIRVPERRLLQVQARAWFGDGGPDFRMVCELAGLEPEPVRAHALRMIGLEP